MRNVIFPAMLAVISVTCAHAQDIRWKPELLQPGDYVTIDQSVTGRIHHVFRGKSGPNYIIDSYRGAKPSGTPTQTTHLDKDGNHLRWQDSSGRDIRYKPHDCTRTLGRCTFTEIHLDGTRKKNVRMTRLAENGFRFTQMEVSGKVVFDGETVLGDRGFAGDGFVKFPDKAQRFTLIQRSFQN